jgi:uncharacterized protein (TIGR03083 family)
METADSATPRTKAGLMARIDRSRSALEAALAGATETQLATPGAGGWSVKDHLAHLATWEQSLLALLEGRPRYASIGVDRVTQETAGVDALNALIDERNKDRPLTEVLDLFHRSHEEVLASIAPLTDVDLLRPYSHYQPDDPPFNPDPVVGWIAGNTYEHFDEHLTSIRSLLGPTGGVETPNS